MAAGSAHRIGLSGGKSKPRSRRSHESRCGSEVSAEVLKYLIDFGEAAEMAL
jgi:hypothetical protein